MITHQHILSSYYYYYYYYSESKFVYYFLSKTDPLKSWSIFLWIPLFYTPFSSVFPPALRARRFKGIVSHLELHLCCYRNSWICIEGKKILHYDVWSLLLIFWFLCVFNILFSLFTKLFRHFYSIYYSTASQHANKVHQISTVNWLDFHPVSAQWYPASTRGTTPPNSHINAGALQYFMHPTRCSWCFPFCWLSSCVCNV